MGEELVYLIYFLEKAGLTGSHFASTAEIAEELAVSQQTVSRKLIELEQKGFITRMVKKKGIDVQLTHQGRTLLKQEYMQLKQHFDHLELHGVVCSGLGEGKYYMSVYKEKIQQAIGFEPFLGTFNVRVDPVIAQQLLKTIQPVFIEPFKTKERSFGGLTIYPIKLMHTHAAVVVPERTSHTDNVLEIIAPHELRKKHSLQDGDEVKIRL